MKRGFDFLMERMRSRRPALLLGAGFSVGAVNGEGNSLLLASQLSCALYDHFFSSGGRSGIDPAILRDIERKKMDLKELCTYLRDLGMVDERDEFLTKIFSGCRPSPEGYHGKLSQYPWEYIFTTNIDDLVEAIYRDAQTALSVWDRSNPTGTIRGCDTNLIKLHGSVDDPGSGYVFDDFEYRDFTIDANSLLKEFAHQALQHDLILVGMQFQEEDLQTILDIYERSGYSSDPYYRIFILPNVEGRLRLRLESSPRDVWIQGDTKTFLETLDREIVIPNREKSYLKEKGAVFLEDISWSTPSSFNLYKGMEAVYPDFFHEADIFPQDLEAWKKEIASSSETLLMAFYGECYVGKSCFVKRLLVELFKEGYTAIQLNRFDDRVSDLLLSYLQSLPKGARVAVYMDDASYYYKQFLDIKNRRPPNVGKLVLITEDTKENHSGKAYILLDDEESRQHLISAEMNAEYARAIYERLARNKRLNKYLNCLPPKTRPFSRRERELITAKIREEHDIIDALYYSTEGVPFQKHYEKWLRRYASDGERKLLYQLSYLFRLGIVNLPNPLVTKLGRKLNRNFRLSDFGRKYGEVVRIASGHTRLYRGRILNQLIDVSDAALCADALRETALYTVPAREGTRNEAASIFEKCLRVKRIRSEDLLTKQELLDLLKGLEDRCGHMSYFWVQYGIAAQINMDYENANNHLLYAHRMRPQSYNVNHALAKNKMEWGLYLIQTGLGDGEQKFQEGAEEMHEIALNRGYSGGYRYSVHTYVRMWLSYARVTRTVLPGRVCDRCAALLEVLLGRPLDNMLTALIKSFIAYCENNGREEASKGLRSVYKKPERDHVEDSAYDID